MTWNVRWTSWRCWWRQSHMWCELMRSDGDWPVDPCASWEVNCSVRMTESLHKGVWQSNLHRCHTHTHTYTHSFWCSATAVQMSPVKSYLWRRENTLLHPQLIKLACESQLTEILFKLLIIIIIILLRLKFAILSPPRALTLQTPNSAQIFRLFWLALLYLF